MGSLRAEQVGLVVDPRHHINTTTRASFMLRLAIPSRPTKTGLDTPVVQRMRRLSRQARDLKITIPPLLPGTPPYNSGTPPPFLHGSKHSPFYGGASPFHGRSSQFRGSPLSSFLGSPPLLPGTPEYSPSRFSGTPPLFPGKPRPFLGTPRLLPKTPPLSDGAHRRHSLTGSPSPSMFPGCRALLSRKQSSSSLSSGAQTASTPVIKDSPSLLLKTPKLFSNARRASFLAVSTSLEGTPVELRGLPSSSPSPRSSSSSDLPKWNHPGRRGSCVQALLVERGPGAITHKDINNIEFVKLLGSGGFGSVYKGLMRGVLVAVKRLHLNSRHPDAQKESYRAELHMLTLSHPRVVAGLCAAPAGRDHGPLVVMEYVTERNLLNVINDVSETLDLTRRLKYGYQLSEALSYIHGRSVVHLDVKPANILLTADDSIKLSDFGCCQELGLSGDCNAATRPTRPHLTGTVPYSAPELLRGEAPSWSADIYAVGITLWQLLCRRHPYGSENPHVVVFGVVANNLRPAFPALLKDWWECAGADLHPLEGLYSELVAQCWDEDRGVRPTASLLRDVFEAWLWNY